MSYMADHLDVKRYVIANRKAYSEGKDIVRSSFIEELLTGKSRKKLPNLSLPNFENDKLLIKDVFENALNTEQVLFSETINSLLHHGSHMYFMSKWGSSTIGRFTNELNDLRAKIDNAILTSSYSSGGLWSIFDSFESLDNVDTDNTTLLYDEANDGFYTDNIVNRLELIDDDLSQSLFGAPIVIADFLDTYIGVNKKRSNVTCVINRRIYTSSPIGEIGLKVKILDMERIKKMRSISVKLENGSTIKSITFAYKNKTGTLTKVTSSDAQPIFEIKEEPKEMYLEFISDTPDTFENGNFIHYFKVNSIVFHESNKQAQNDLVTKEMFFAKNGSKVKFSRILVDVGTGKNGLDATTIVETIDPVSKVWSERGRAQAGKPIAVAKGTPFINLGKEQQVVVPFPLEPNYNFATIRYELSDVNIPELDIFLTNSDKTLYSDNIILYRGVGTKAEPNNDDGWVKRGNEYLTTLIVSGLPIRIDFGKNPISINGKKVAGSHLFTDGIYNISVSSQNYQQLSANVTDANVSTADSLYPYNHKYLIQGHPSIVRYKGCGTWCKQICNYVDHNLLMLGLYQHNKLLAKGEYPPIYSLYQDIDNDKTYILVPIDNTYREFYQERVMIQGNYISSQDSVEDFRIRIRLKNNYDSLYPSFIKWMRVKGI